ncbi:hypothetical protein EV44_g6102 [Erysiphe necator]|uniref:Uncharacterized protein n=1 Tax=Uncinula necator TaxID=52586 RepID=A0A0B1P3P8_UNCNE|nr:hypothetical protein EV44_g6102 [Erysiphe necator]
MQSSFNSLTLSKILIIHKDLKTKPECLDELIREIQRLYRGLPRYRRTSDGKDFELRNKLLAACEEDSDCSMACMLPAKTFQALMAQLQTSISLSLKVQKSQQTAHYTVDGYEYNSFYTDRQYYGQKRSQTSSSSANNKEQPKTKFSKKACFVCSKEGCWSTRHSPEERMKSMVDFKSKTLRLTGRRYTRLEIRQFLNDFEGLEPVQEIPDNFSHFHVTQDDEESGDLEDFFRTGNFFTDSQTEITSEAYSDFFPTLRGNFDGYTTDVSLRDKSIGHLLTQSRPCPGSRYSSLKFEAILIDTGAAKISTAGYN